MKAMKSPLFHIWGILNIVLVLAYLGGCKNLRPTPSIPIDTKPLPGPVIHEAATLATATSSAILVSTEKVQAAAIDIDAHRADLSKVKARVAEIFVQCVKLRDQGIEVAKISNMLSTVVRDVQVLEVRDDTLQKEYALILKKVKALEEENKRITEEKNVYLNRALNVFILAGTLCVAICIFLTMTGNTKAIGGAMAGGTLIATSLAVNVLTKMTMLFAVLAGLGLVAIIVILGMQLMDYLRQRKGLAEVVETAELIKKELPTDLKVKAFGGDNSTGIAGQVQSPETVTLVKDIRKHLKK
jgi:hypothetical protein